MLNYSKREFKWAAFVPLVLQISILGVIRLHCSGKCRVQIVQTVHRLQAPIHENKNKTVQTNNVFP